jgi:hypothetical protein
MSGILNWRHPGEGRDDVSLLLQNRYKLVNPNDALGMSR